MTPTTHVSWSSLQLFQRYHTAVSDDPPPQIQTHLSEKISGEYMNLKRAETYKRTRPSPHLLQGLYRWTADSPRSSHPGVWLEVHCWCPNWPLREKISSQVCNTLNLCFIILINKAFKKYFLSYEWFRWPSGYTTSVVCTQQLE